jgi:hypothetical protein
MIYRGFEEILIGQPSLKNRLGFSTSLVIRVIRYQSVALDQG